MATSMAHGASWSYAECRAAQSTIDTKHWRLAAHRPSTQSDLPPTHGPMGDRNHGPQNMHIICSLFTFSQRAMWACLGFYVYVVASKAALALALAFDFAISQRHRAAWTLPRVPHQVLQAAFSTPAGLSAQARRIPEGRHPALTFHPSRTFPGPGQSTVHFALCRALVCVCARTHTDAIRVSRSAKKASCDSRAAGDHWHGRGRVSDSEQPAHPGGLAGNMY